jgi:hypothetical protein
MQPIEVSAAPRPIEPITGGTDRPPITAPEDEPMSRPYPMSPDPAELFRWRAETDSTWTEAAEQASRLLAEVEAGRMTATPAELVALRTFMATVRGMSAERREGTGG